MQYHLGSFGVLNISEMRDEPLVLLDGGIERRQREIYDFQNGKRPGYGGFLFQYTLKGEGIYEREGKQFRVKEGSGFLVRFPEDSRYFLEKTPDAFWEFLYLHFDGSAAGAFAKKLQSICPDLIRLEAGSAPVQMAVNLKERLTGGGQLEKYEGGEFLYQFLCALLREAELPGSSQKSALADRAADYMKKTCRTLPGVGEAAGYVGVSSEHLCRCFRREFGVTPAEYLTRLKLQSAMRDLLSTEKSVERIARDNGFSNGNYFGKVFRRYMGISPGAYRKQQRPGLTV